jgi:hypothetical protein
MPAEDLLQGPEIVGSEAGTYEISFDADIPEGYDNLKLVVEGTNVDGETTTNSKTYSIDMVAPIITVINPEEGEEFVIEGETVMMSVSAGVVDIDSGVNTVSLKVDGELVEAVFEDGSIVFNGEFGLGEHTVEVVAEDHVLNVSNHMWSFTVTQTASPVVITFEPYGYNNWWGPEYYHPFVVNVTGDVGVNGIVASFLGMPAGDLLQGPEIIGSEAGTYNVYFSADIPEGYENLMLVIEGTNVDGETTVNNATFAIDMMAPVIIANAPAVDQEFDIEGESIALDVRAYVYDDDSGVSMVHLEVDGVVVEAEFEEGVVTYRGDFGLGEHTVEVFADDNVMNESSLMWTFYVVDVNLPIVIEDAHVYPNPVDFEESVLNFHVDTSKASTVTVTIYDFAGNEVISMTSNGRDALVWDGKTTRGVRVARGVYFAKVSAGDGKKVADKIIKIAIKG